MSHLRWIFQPVIGTGSNESDNNHESVDSVADTCVNLSRAQISVLPYSFRFYIHTRVPSDKIKYDTYLGSESDLFHAVYTSIEKSMTPAVTSEATEQLFLISFLYLT